MNALEQLFQHSHKLMAIGAHPDDIDIECGGALALLKRLNKEIIYLVCSSGEKGANNLSQGCYDLARMREQEQIESAKVIGSDTVIFLRYKDGELENTQAFRAKLVEMIRQYKPSILFAPDPANLTFSSPGVNHRDHRITGEAVFDAAYPASGNVNFFQEHLAAGLTPHQVDGIYFYASHAPDFHVDIGDVMDLKINALLCHKSQISYIQNLAQRLRARYGAIGQQVGCEYAEAFRRLQINK
jgi:LmbE family N-acetylglucosaminyl deacetylase